MPYWTPQEPPGAPQDPPEGGFRGRSLSLFWSVLGSVGSLWAATLVFEVMAKILGKRGFEFFQTFRRA